MVSANAKPLPAPPVALKVRDPRGDTVGEAGEIARPPLTEISALAPLPSESVTRTTSTLFGVVPAT